MCYYIRNFNVQFVIFIVTVFLIRSIFVSVNFFLMSFFLYTTNHSGVIFFFPVLCSIIFHIIYALYLSTVSN